MTNLTEAIQNACEIARRDERRKFKEYLEKKKRQYAMPNGKNWYTYDDYVMRKWFTRCLNEIINELFKEESSDRDE